jgi:hypothetical protein
MSLVAGASSAARAAQPISRRTLLGDLALPPGEHQHLAQGHSGQEDRRRERVAGDGERRSGSAEEE